MLRALAGNQECYQVKNSIMLDSSQSQYLNRNFGAPTDGKKWTYSGWLKRGKLGDGSIYCFPLMSANASHCLNITRAANWPYTGALVDQITYSSASISNSWTALLRDVSSHYHVVVNFDSTQTIATDRIKVFLNNTQLPVQAAFAWPTLNSNSDGLNTAVAHTIGGGLGGQFYDGYMSEVVFVDGQSLNPSYFGRKCPVSGEWEPKRYKGTFGVNGSYLEFKNGAALGTDTSGNGNNWTLNGGIVAANQFTDTPSNNFPVLNLVNRSLYTSLSAGSLKVAGSGPSVTGGVAATFPCSRNSGLTYWEITVQAVGTTFNPGICREDNTTLSNGGDAGYTAQALTYLNNGQKGINGTYSAYGAAYTSGAVICVAVDWNNGAIYFRRDNNAWENGGDPTSGAAKTGAIAFAVGNYLWMPFMTLYSNTIAQFNFGQRPFTYSMPAGYKSLCTKKMPNPSILRPEKQFGIALATGANLQTAIDSLKVSNKSLVWAKNRTSAADHIITDTVRGAFSLASNTTAAETAFAGYSGTDNHVAWVFNKGVVPGLDIVTATFAATGNQTVNHGLGALPDFIIGVQRNGVGDRYVWHKSLAGTESLRLNQTAAKVADSRFGSLSSTTFTFNVPVAGNWVFYVFHEVPGFSKFGSYVGNGSTDGPFVCCGFRPRWIMIKRTDSSPCSWIIEDSTRSTSNPSVVYINGEGSAPEQNTGAANIDFVATGFKLRATNGDLDGNAGTFIYMTFAEMPSKYALAR